MRGEVELRTQARRLLVQARARPALTGALALFVALTLAYSASIDIRASRGASITGDEPFYLITTQSLLQDGNLDLRNQYDTHSYESFFDHADGLWRQSVPLDDGRVLSPHNPGLAVLLLPGFALGGLAGAQFQLVLIAALTWALAYVLALRLTGARPALVWLATAVVGLTATAFIYSSEIYPEIPAGLALVGALLVATRRERLAALPVLAIVALLSVLPWLGAKYAPLAALVALYVLWRAWPVGRVVLLVGAAVSAAAYAAFHLAVYESLTPYNVNVIYAGETTASTIGQHVEIGDRVYRLWGLLIDRRFGVARWAPVLFAVVPGAVLLLRGDARLRLVLGLVVVQVLIATFVVITMMGWWFPGRTLVTVFPLLPIPMALLAMRYGRWGQTALGVLGLYSLGVTAALAEAGRSREVVIAVDPFDMGANLFQGVSRLFPQYTAWTTETWVLTVLWLALGGLALAAWATLDRDLGRESQRRPGPPDQPEESSSSPDSARAS
ncbi:MAG: hypothetical protein OXI51_03780 [Chloroflexota bacterium]|nr:hypothetical protein [Chloroflexota bacterium]